MPSRQVGELGHVWISRGRSGSKCFRLNVQLLRGAHQAAVRGILERILVAPDEGLLEDEPDPKVATAAGGHGSGRHGDDSRGSAGQ